jgi:hypothetical protein
MVFPLVGSHRVGAFRRAGKDLRAVHRRVRSACRIEARLNVLWIMRRIKSALGRAMGLAVEGPRAYHREAIIRLWLEDGHGQE